MRQLRTKGRLLAAVAVIMLAGWANAHAGDLRTAEQPTIEELQPFNLYRVPSDASQVNSAILEVCPMCAQVEKNGLLEINETSSWLVTNKCDLHTDLVKLSTQLGTMINEIHQKHRWSVEEMKNNQPENCALELLQYRINIALQIMKRSLQ